MTKLPRRAALIAIVPLAVAFAAAFAALVQQSDGGKTSIEAETNVSGVVSSLDRPALKSDRLPPWIQTTPAASRFDDPSRARLGAVVGERRYFVVPGRGNSLCLIFTEGAGADGSSGGTCAGRVTLRTGSIYLSQPNADGTATIAGIASDELTQAYSGSESVPVSGNVYVLRNATAPTVILSGDRAVIEVEVGLSAPVATVTTS